jgi:hypothetical protein
MPNAQCPMPHALSPMPYALCPMPYALCPMPSRTALFLRKAMQATKLSHGRTKKLDFSSNS